MSDAQGKTGAGSRTVGTPLYLVLDVGSEGLTLKTLFSRPGSTR